MRLCPKCGSKELIPVVFGKKSDHSKIIQKKIDDALDEEDFDFNV